MSILSPGNFFAIDIGTTAIRVVELRGGGGSKALVRYGSIPVDYKTAQSDSAADRTHLLEALTKLINSVGVSTRNVVVGVPSSRMFATIVDMPKLDKPELDKTIQYQAEQYIPMSLDEAEIDWQVLGDSPVAGDKSEVLLVSSTKKFTESRLDLLESIGLNVVALEPDPLALTRALLPFGSTGAVMLLDIGNQSTDLIVAIDTAPRLIRSIPTGGASFVRSAMQNLNVDEKQAEQFVFKFGLNQQKLEGQVFKAIESTVDGLVAEVQKSVKFFTNRYKNVAIEKIVVSGGASTLPEFPLYIANKLNMQVEIGNSWQNVSYPSNLNNDLLAISSRFGVAVGLAEREQ
ncbi:type IV pilus assembly protein PilM [Candidatus Saccharibacteria bacterium CPR2]|nr:type IV pilus assembly protein PilM [Candidatus Saccharibacteria bacterium CPR2]